MAIVRKLAASSKPATDTGLNIVERVAISTMSKVLQQKALVQATWDMRDVTGQATYDRTRAYLEAKSK